MEAQPDAHPIEVADQGITGLEYPIKHVVHMLGGVVVAHHGDGSMGPSTNDQETTNPHVVGKYRKLRWVIDTYVWIWRHRIHVLGNDDG